MPLRAAMSDGVAIPNLEMAGPPVLVQERPRAHQGLAVSLRAAYSLPRKHFHILLAAMRARIWKDLFNVPDELPLTESALHGD
jgi:hypothetical protein